METKTLASVELKFDDSGAGSVQGYGSTFGNVDRQKDQVNAGAYRDTIPWTLKTGWLGVNHDWRVQVGYFKTLAEDSQGLYFDAAFHSDEESQRYRTRVRERLEQDKYVASSIGYEPDEGGTKVEGGVRHLNKLRLFEISLVSVPANELAVITAAKGFRLPDRDDASSGDTPATFAAHADRVLVDVEAFLSRAGDLTSLRAKEGRVLSASNREKLSRLLEALAAMGTDLDELLAATAPKQPEKRTDPSRLRFDHDRLKARVRLLGAAV